MNVPSSPISVGKLDLKQHGSDYKVEADTRSDTGVGEVAQVSKKFNTLSTLSLTVSLMATWEALGGTLASGLTAGGPVSLVYGFIGAFLGSLAISTSLGEQASMFPTSGGQYHFVYELSPARSKAVVSWYCGWITLLGWLAFTASAPFVVGSLIQALIGLNNPAYQPERWHLTLIYTGVVFIAFLINYWGARALPMLENLFMLMHVGLFVVMFVVTLVIPPTRNSAEFVFTKFQNSTGWENDGIAWCLGMLTAAYVMIGFDSATHISEEIHNPRVGVPRAMVFSLLINGSMGFAFIMSMLFGMGDLETALNGPIGFPTIQIFYGMTRGNLAATTAMTCTIVLSASGAAVGLMTSTSRTLWAFARDNAPPFSGWLAEVHPRTQVPANAVLCTSVGLVLLGLLNIGSTTAFNAILSLTVVGLYVSYLFPIVAMMYRRLYEPESLNYGPWRLSKAVGYLANIVSIGYILFLAAFLMLPPVQPVTAVNMNYGSLLLGSVLIFATVDWVFRGKKVYNGPIYDTLHESG